MSRRGSFTGEDAAGGIAVLTLVLAGVLLWFLLRLLTRLLVATATEALHLYRDSRTSPGLRRVMLLCGAALAVLIGLCAALCVLVPATTPGCVAIAVWGLALGVIGIELRDHAEHRNDLGHYLSMSRSGGMLGGKRQNAA